MGADFVEKAARTFRKSWDRARVLLGTADLFTRVPESVSHTIAAKVVGGAKLVAGEKVTVEECGPIFIVRRGLTEVAVADEPPSDLADAVRDSCGIGKGTVEQVHQAAGIVEISIC